MDRDAIIRRMETAILRWYPFRKDARCLYIGSEQDALPVWMNESGKECLCTGFDELGTVPERQFDYIVCIETIEEYKEPIWLLEALCDRLNSLGVLLLGVNNRLSLKGLCGDRDPYTGRNFDGFENYRNVKDIEGRCYSKNQWQSFFTKAGLGRASFYAVYPDLKHAHHIFAEDILPNESMNNRFSTWYRYPSAALINEKELMDDMIEEGLFHHFADAYLIEWSKNITQRNKTIASVTLSLDRKPEDCMITCVHYEDEVRKYPVYPEGKNKLCSVLENNKRLNERGIRTIPTKIEEDVLVMPLIKEQTAQKYLEQLLKEDVELFVEEMDRFRELIIQAGEIIEEDAVLGPIQSYGYPDMVPLNAFHIDGSYIFFDQEFAVQAHPVNVTVTRMIDSFYHGNLTLDNIFSGQILLKKYGLFEHYPEYNRRQLLFLNNHIENELLFDDKMDHDIDIRELRDNRDSTACGARDYHDLCQDALCGIEEKKVILFGTGTYAKAFIEKCGDEFSPVAAIDNNPHMWGKEWNGISVHDPQWIQSNMEGDHIVFICVKNYAPIKSQLRSMGIERSKYRVYSPNTNINIRRNEL